MTLPDKKNALAEIIRYHEETKHHYHRYARSAGYMDWENQPNPFRPSTQIRFSLPDQSDVDLTVYNVNGRIVRKLAAGVREAGSYTVDWDGRDHAGSALVPDIYMVQMQAPDRSQTHRVNLRR